MVELYVFVDVALELKDSANVMLIMYASADMALNAFASADMLLDARFRQYNTGIGYGDR